MLYAKQISKSFENFEVLRDINLNISSKEIVSILGPSGCGKSTLLKILAGLDTCHDGAVVKQTKEQGYLFQERELLSWRSVQDNIALGMEYARLPREMKEQRANWLVQRLQLQQCRHLPPSKISGGMTRRAALAQVLAPFPKLVFLDEPLSGLDINGRRVVSRLIKDYVELSCAAVVVVTHSIEEAIFMSTKVHVLSNNPAQIEFSLAITETNHSTAFGAICKQFELLNPITQSANAH